MALIYLDASVVVPFISPEPARGAITTFLVDHGGDVIVSDFAAGEVASAIARVVRMGGIDTEDGLGRLRWFDEWRLLQTLPCEILSADLRLADAFVRRFELKLRFPDAINIAICRRVGAALATLDQRTVLAAKSLDITLVSFAFTEG